VINQGGAGITIDLDTGCCDDANGSKIECAEKTVSSGD
jgi:hypothetical protein